MTLNVTDVCNVTVIDEVRVFQRIAYIPVFTLGLLLNAWALRVFFQKRASWTDTHIYMINLAVAHSALIIFLPFRILHVFAELEVSSFCTFLISIHYSNIYASIFTVTGISVHRFIAVKFPFRNRAWGFKKPVALAVCIILWGTVVTICTVFHEENLPKHLQSCFHRGSSPLPLQLVLVLLMLGFFLPCCTILFCSSQVICTLMKDKVDAYTYEEKRKSVAVITANLTVFIVCFTPFHVSLLIKFIVGTQSQSIPNCALYNLVHNVFVVSEWIATTNCCLDAIGYYFFYTLM